MLKSRTISTASARKLTATVLVAMCAISVRTLSSQTTERRWLPVHIGGDSSTSAIDTSSIAYSGDTALVWVRTQYATPRSGGTTPRDYVSSTSKIAISCKDRRFSNVYVVDYSADGSVVDDFDFQKDGAARSWNNIPPETLAEHVLVAACPGESRYWRTLKRP